MRFSAVLCLSLMLMSALIVPVAVMNDRNEAADLADIDVSADDPDRDRMIAGVVILALVLSVLAAIYQVSKREGL